MPKTRLIAIGSRVLEAHNTDSLDIDTENAWAAAWTLRRLAGDALRITLIEKSPVLGGWIQTERSPRRGLLFERGPRGFRPTGPGEDVLRVVDELGLDGQAIGTDPASSTRWLWLDGRLQSLPGGLLPLFTTPMGRKIVAAVAREPFQPASASTLHSRGARGTDSSNAAGDDAAEDESIHDFISRRFGPFVAESLMDAMVGGIFAGDTRKLSVVSCFSRLWELERNHGSIVGGMLKEAAGEAWSRFKSTDKSSARSGSGIDPTIEELLQQPLTKTSSLLKKSLQVSFRDGMATITNELGRRVASHPNTDVIVDCEIKLLEPCFGAADAVPVTHGFELGLSGGRFFSYIDSAQPEPPLGHASGTNAIPTVLRCDQVLSTISAPALGSMIRGAPSTSQSEAAEYAAHSLEEVAEATSVAVVNIAYDGAVLRQSGFGHLVPSREHEDALGVVWDSCVFPQQDLATGSGVPATRLTVMMGGEHAHMRHLVSKSPETGSVDLEKLGNTAKRLVAQHLGINEQPCDLRVGVAEGCIPQYTLGHRSRVARAERALRDWGGEGIRAVGTSFYGAYHR